MAECNEHGLLTAFVLFDLDDTRAVQREAWARWAAIDPDMAHDETTDPCGTTATRQTD